MGCKKRSGDFLSSDGHSRTSWFIWTPEEAVPSAILQISHGMCEYIERYESEGFIDAMTSASFVVCGNDHIGHGRCAQENGDLGYFTDFSNLVDDLHTLNGIVRQTYRSLPYILLGHSMGSFVAREYIVKYDDIDGAIICGTSAGNQPLRAAVMLAATLARLRGERHISRRLAAMSFGGYNDAFAEEHDGDSWLCSDPEVRRRYRADPLCNFTFSVSAYRELFRMLSDISDKRGEPWSARVPQSLPVLLIAGDADPLGENGKGIREVYDRLSDAELCELSMKLYHGGRHEILNDVMKHEVCSDIAEWIRSVATGVAACRGASVK